MADRVRGQENIITIIRDGVLVTRITTIQTAEFTPRFNTSEEGYLGETTIRVDQIFNGVNVKITGHLESPEWFELIKDFRDKASRRAGGTVRVDLATTFIFPTGEVKTYSIPDIAVSDMQTTTGSREDYVEFSMDAIASDFLELA